MTISVLKSVNVDIIIGVDAFSFNNYLGIAVKVHVGIKNVHYRTFEVACGSDKVGGSRIRMQYGKSACFGRAPAPAYHVVILPGRHLDQFMKTKRRHDRRRFWGQRRRGGLVPAAAPGSQRAKKQ